MKQGDLVSGTVTSLAFGGKGILKVEGMVIFCPFVMPGDEITCRIVKQKKSFAEAALISVNKAAPGRVAPRCPYFGSCGGCQIQEIPYEEQLEYKRQSIEEAFLRIGKIQVTVPSIKPSQFPWEYRRRIQLQLAWTPKGYELGYISWDNKELVKIDCCPIFLSEEDPFIQELQSYVATLQNESKSNGRLTIMKDPQIGFHLDFHFEKVPKSLESFILQGMKRFPSWKSVGLHAPGVHKSYGKPSQEYELDGVQFQLSSTTFSQNHPMESARIYEELQKAIRSYPEAHVLDLYSGIGMTSFLVKKHVKAVTGIEISKEATQLAKSTADSLGWENIVFRAGDVEQILPTLTPIYEIVITNPPRTGMAPKILEEIIRLKPKDIFYISCMPPTMARDIQILSQKGYQVVQCLGFDMFPQTGHVEVFVHLKCVQATI